MSTQHTLTPEHWRPHLIRAIELVGGQAEMARRLDLAQPTVWEWVHKRRTPLRVEIVLKIEVLTEKQVSRHELRPDVFGPPPEAGHRDEREGQAA